jgi:predicted ArsR family transcriptional regulator
VQFDDHTSCWQYMGDGQARTMAEQEVYELLGEIGEADAGTLARELGKHRVTVRHTLLRLQSKGHVSTKEAPARQRRGKTVLFYIPEGTTETPQWPVSTL